MAPCPRACILATGARGTLLYARRFHGKFPGKMKQEKRLKKFEEEMKLRHCDATDTPLNTMKARPLDHAYAGPERLVPCVRHAPTDGSPPVCQPAQQF